jgi:hypothetical protein
MLERGMLHATKPQETFPRFDGLIISQSSVYGKCIFADYNNVHKNMCATEFLKLKECYLVRLHTPSCCTSQCLMMKYVESV